VTSALGFLQAKARKSTNNIHTSNLHHVNSTADETNTKKIYQANLDYKRPKGRREARWKDDDIRKTGVATWTEVAQDRDGGEELGKRLFFLDCGGKRKKKTEKRKRKRRKKNKKRRRKKRRRRKKKRTTKKKKKRKEKKRKKK
jgi:hypothetical protein